MSQLAAHKLRFQKESWRREKMPRGSGHRGEETEASHGRAAFPQTAYISLKAVVIP